MRSIQQRNRKNFLKNIPEHLSIFKKVIRKLEKIFFIYYDEENHLYIYDLTKTEKKWLKEQKFLEDNKLALKLKNHFVSYISIENRYLRVPRTDYAGFDVVSEEYITIHTIKNHFIDFENNKIKKEFYPQKNWINFYNPYQILYCSSYSKKKYPLQLKTILTLTEAQKIFLGVKLWQTAKPVKTRKARQKMCPISCMRRPWREWSGRSNGCGLR